MTRYYSLDQMPLQGFYNGIIKSLPEKVERIEIDANQELVMWNKHGLAVELRNLTSKRTIRMGISVLGNCICYAFHSDKNGKYVDPLKHIEIVNLFALLHDLIR